MSGSNSFLGYLPLVVRGLTLLIAASLVAACKGDSGNDGRDGQDGMDAVSPLPRSAALPRLQPDDSVRGRRIGPWGKISNPVTARG